MTPQLSIRDLTVRFKRPGGFFRAVDGVSLLVEKGEILALVGESGSGKTLTARAILRLLPPGAEIEGGSIILGETDLMRLTEREMRSVRGRRVALTFQEPLAALNPIYSIGEQISEVFRVHQGMKRAAAWECAVAGLAEVGIQSPQKRVFDYPHQLSGGERQRVLLAIALASRPTFLIVDEPTTALDVIVQAQVLDLLLRLREERGLTILLITHDLAIVAEIATRVAVMYAGQVVEQAKVKDLFQRPLHPYTQGLLASIPRMTGEPVKRLVALAGSPPDSYFVSNGCRFSPRCPLGRHECEQMQLLEEVAPGRSARCWRIKEWLQ